MLDIWFLSKKQILLSKTKWNIFWNSHESIWPHIDLKNSHVYMKSDENGRFWIEIAEIIETVANRRSCCRIHGLDFGGTSDSDSPNSDWERFLERRSTTSSASASQSVFRAKTALWPMHSTNNQAARDLVEIDFKANGRRGRSGSGYSIWSLI